MRLQDTKLYTKSNHSLSYTPKGQVKFELKTQYYFISTPQMKYVGRNITNYEQDRYDENYKTLINEIQELNKWGDSPCSRVHGWEDSILSRC